MGWNYLELEDRDREAHSILTMQTKAIWNQNFNLWQISDEELEIHPELKRLKNYTYTQAKEKEEHITLAMNGYKHAEKDRADINERVYLDFVPPSLAKWVDDPASGFKYDPIEHQYYCSEKLASTSSYSSKIKKCQRPRGATSLDINNGKPTKGKVLFAMAVNEPDFAKREQIIALAINECAKEHAHGEAGAVRNFNEIYAFFDKNHLPLGYRKTHAMSQAFYGRVTMGDNGKFKTEKAQLDAFDRAERKSLDLCGKNAVNNIINAVDGRINNLMRKDQPKEDLIAKCNKIFSDQVVATAIYANTRMRANNGNDQSELLKEQFSKKIDALQKHIKNKYDKKIAESTDNKTKQAYLKEYGNLSSQIKTMETMANGYAKKITDRCNDVMSLKKGEPLTQEEILKQCALNDGESGQMIKAFVKHDLHVPRKMNVHQYTQDTKVELKDNEKPLYLVMDHEERNMLSDEMRKLLRTDPFHGSLCVADTAENQELFKQYLPSLQEQRKLEKHFVEFKEKIAYHLSENGVQVNPEDIDIDPNPHKVGNFSYKINTYESKPTLQIENLITHEQQNLSLGMENVDLFEDYKRNFQRTIASKNAKDMQNRESVSNFIDENFRNGNMLEITQKTTNLDFPLFNGKEIDVANIGGFIDKSGVYSGYIFENDPKTVQTTTSVFFPMFNTAGKVVNTMALADNGKQEFVNGASFRGSFSLAGENLKDLLTSQNPQKDFEKIFNSDTKKAVIVTTDPISASVIAKYATKDTIVVSANTADNIKFVAESLAKKYPNLGIAIMGELNMKNTNADGVNIGIHEAEHTARIALRDLRPMTKAYFPAFTREQLANGCSTYADMYATNRDVLQQQIVTACYETIDNHEISRDIYKVEKQEAIKLNKMVKAQNLEFKKEQIEKENLENANTNSNVEHDNKKKQTNAQSSSKTEKKNTAHR